MKCCSKQMQNVRDVVALVAKTYPLKKMLKGKIYILYALEGELLSL